MYAKFRANQPLQLPMGFSSLLRSLVTEMMRFQPKNIPLFCALYFDAVLQEQSSVEGNANLESQVTYDRVHQLLFQKMKKYLTPRKALITERNRSLSLANTSTVGVSAETVKVELNDGQSLKLQENEVESCENVLLLLSLDSATQPPKSAVSSTEGRKSSRCQRRMTLVPKIAEFPADVAATKIQAGVKGYLARKEFERQKRAAIKIESEFRSYLVRKEFKNIKKAAVTVQSTFRGRNARKSMMSTGQVISKLFGAKFTKNH